MKLSLCRCGLLLAGLALAGCGRHDESAAPQTHAPGAPPAAHEAEAGVSFHPKSGLLVPAATAEFIGLRVADVEEQTVSTVLRFSAQVYRVPGEVQPVSFPAPEATARASGWITAADAAQLRPAQPVMIEIDGQPPGAGQIVALNRPLPNGGAVEVLLEVRDPDRGLTVGQHLSVVAPGERRAKVARIPRAALLQTVEGHFVYTVSGAHFVRAPVKVGTVDDEFAEITDGLYPGDQVVAHPVMTLWLAELHAIRAGKACADDH